MKYTYKQNLLTMFIYILENKEINYMTYKEAYGIQRTNEADKKYLYTDLQIFMYLLQNINNILKELNFNCEIYTESNGKYTYFYYHFTNKRILFNVNDLTIEQYKKYDLIVFYLLLFKKQYVTFNILNKITKGVIHYKKLARLKNQLQDVILEEICKNSVTKSYQLIDDDI